MQAPQAPAIAGMSAPVAVQMVSSGVHQEFLHPTMQTKIPGQVQVTYLAPLHPNAKCLYGICSANFCCWDTVKKRSYVMVTENKLETNYPILCSPFCPVDACIVDVISSKYFDKTPKNWEAASSCTPFHFCYCVECSGQVAVASPFPGCETCPARVLFPCFQCYVPGLQNAPEFCAHMKTALEGFHAKHRVTGSTTVMQGMADGIAM